MDYYLYYKDNKIIGYSNCLNISDDFECVKVTEEEYINYLNTSKKPTKKSQIADLKMWFNTYYTEHEQKYRRLHSLNLLCDDGSKPYDKLLELYKEAEEKRKQIQELGG